MLLKRHKHKQFEYLPRFYDPDSDPELKRRERFRITSNTRRGKRPSMIRLVVWLLAAIITYFLLIG